MLQINARKPKEAKPGTFVIAVRLFGSYCGFQITVMEAQFEARPTSIKTDIYNLLTDLGERFSNDMDQIRSPMEFKPDPHGKDIYDFRVNFYLYPMPNSGNEFLPDEQQCGMCIATDHDMNIVDMADFLLDIQPRLNRFAEANHHYVITK